MFWQRNQLLIGGLLVAVLGVLGSLFHDSLPWPWLQHLVRDLAVALFVAGILAASVDPFVRRELGRDAFAAAFQYVLPDELKPEIQRIIQYKFLCVRHRMTLHLVPIENGLFRLEMSSQRTVRNISWSNQQIKNRLGMDEWGHEVKSCVERCTMTFKGKEYASKPVKEYGDDALGRETVLVTIKHKEEAVLVSKGFEIKTANSEYMINFTCPTVNPVVDVYMPQGFKHTFSFGVPGEEVTKSGITETYELNGTHFPGQFMRLRWWRETSPSGTLAK